MKSLKCVSCGKANPSFNCLCKDCYLEERPLIRSIRGVNKFRLSICHACRSTYYKNSWAHSDEENRNKQFKNAIINGILQQYRFRPTKALHFKVLEYYDKETNAQITEKTCLVNTKVELEWTDDPFLPNLSMILNIEDIRIRWRICPNCTDNREGHFNFIVQIRSSGDLNDINEVTNALDEILQDLPKTDYINDVYGIQEQKNGFDVNFRSEIRFRSFASKISQRFCTKKIESVQPTTFNNEKQRFNVKKVISLRLPPWKVRDLIFITLDKNDAYQILKCEKHNLKTFCYRDFQIHNISAKKLWENPPIRIIKYTEFSEFQFLSTDSEGEYLLMSLDNYDIHIVTDPYLKRKETGKSFLGVLWNGHLFLNHHENLSEKIESTTR